MKKKKEKGKDMAAPRYGGIESLLQIKEKAKPEAGTSGRIHSGHDPEPGEGGK